MPILKPKTDHVSPNEPHLSNPSAEHVLSDPKPQMAFVGSSNTLYVFQPLASSYVTIPVTLHIYPVTSS